MKTGDIILMRGYGKLSVKIQKFQSRDDAESGKWNHSGIIFMIRDIPYVCHAYYIEGRKLKSAIVITPLEYFQNEKYELLLLEHSRPDLIPDLEFEMMSHVGKPYAYLHLAIVKPIQILFNKYIGCKKNTDRRFICHEFTKTVWHNVAGYFDKPHEGNVKDIYHNLNFNKKWNISELS